MSDIHALSGAYALDSVDDIERATFERHLRECDTCAQEVRELQATVARLADESATPPPPGLRAEVLRQISQTPQLTNGQAARVSRSQAAQVTRWRRYAAVSVAAAVAAIAVGAGTWAVSEARVRDARDQLAAERRNASDMQRVLAAPDARVLTGPGRDGGSVTLVMSRSQDAAVAMLGGMPDVGDKTYQLWLITGNQAQSQGIVGNGVTAGAMIVRGLGSADTFGVTVEKPGGAQQPDLTQLIRTLSLS
ncbi:anti-sigma factor [Virgisporangium aliadipatigenens]|nr:anti-sigma factor [Virgisporangium aliadipatigenens]